MNHLHHRKLDKTGPIEHIRRRLIERIPQVIDDHRATPSDAGAQAACSWGATGLSDHSGHVAEQIVEQLVGLKPDIDDAKQRIRYTGAWLNRELTKMEGVEY